MVEGKRAATWGGRESGRHLPLCREPWESYYILRRGILPCCYGFEPLAPMSEWRRVWNSPALQEIREYLARGELSPYCRQSVSCPIVQRVLADKLGRQPTTASPLRQDHPLLDRLDRLLLGLPAAIFGLVKRLQGRDR